MKIFGLGFLGGGFGFGVLGFRVLGFKGGGWVCWSSCGLGLMVEKKLDVRPVVHVHAGLGFRV